MLSVLGMLGKTITSSLRKMIKIIYTSFTIDCIFSAMVSYIKSDSFRKVTLLIHVKRHIFSWMFWPQKNSTKTTTPCKQNRWPPWTLLEVFFMVSIFFRCFCLPCVWLTRKLSLNKNSHIFSVLICSKLFRPTILSQKMYYWWFSFVSVHVYLGSWVIFFEGQYMSCRWNKFTMSC